MPVSFNQIVSNLASVTFTYAEQPVTVIYYPSKITEKTFAELQSFARMTEDTIVDMFGELNGMLATLIKSWDVYADDEQSQMFPLQVDRLAELPIVFRQ